MNALHTETNESGYTLSIYQDDDIENPREWYDHFGTMICYHGRYNLGDNREREDHFPDQDDLKEFMEDHGSAIVRLPVYLMDHSGLWASTTSFGCPWDSGIVGWIFATSEEIKAEYNVDHIDAELCKKVQCQLRAEVEEYNQYLTGDVYGYTITTEKTCEHCKHTEEIRLDSLWGLYGHDYALEKGQQMLEEYTS